MIKWLTLPSLPLQSPITSVSPPEIETYYVSEADPNVVIGTGSDSRHFVSEDAGKTWRKVLSRTPIERFIFHPKRPTWAIVTSQTDDCEDPTMEEDFGPCNHMAWITTDLGKTFTPLNS